MDEDDLKWVKNKDNCYVLVKQFQGYFHQKPLVVGKLNLHTVMENDALMHREG